MHSWNVIAETRQGTFSRCSLSKAIARRCSVKMMFWNILQYLQEIPVLESHFNKVTGHCNIHRKIPVLESHFNKVTGHKASNSIKKRLQHSCFPVSIANFLRTPANGCFSWSEVNYTWSSYMYFSNQLGNFTLDK